MAKFVVISAVESESEPESLSEEEGDSELEEDEEEELELGDEPESGSAARVRTFRSWSDPASATMQPPSRLLSWWRCKSAISPTSMVQFVRLPLDGAAAAMAAEMFDSRAAFISTN